MQLIDIVHLLINDNDPTIVYQILIDIVMYLLQAVYIRMHYPSRFDNIRAFWIKPHSISFRAITSIRRETADRTARCLTSAFFRRASFLSSISINFLPVSVGLFLTYCNNFLHETSAIMYNFNQNG